MRQITEPGFYDIPASDYHADPCFMPSLSSSVADVLINQTPRHAWMAHPRLNWQHKAQSTDEMDLGTVAHEIVLGKGGGFAISPYETYQSNAAKAWKAETIAAGKTPIKKAQHLTALEIAGGVGVSLGKMSCAAERVFLDGRAEVVLLWKDIGGPWCRAMLDWLYGANVYDLKTTGSGLSDRALASKIGDGLDMKAAFHLRGLEQVAPELAGRTRWHWVFAETKPPYEVRIVEMDGHTRHMGDRKAAYAIELWRRCLEANEWPGYPRQIEHLEYPVWAEQQWIAREMTDDVALKMRLIHQPAAERAVPLTGAW